MRGLCIWSALAFLLIFESVKAKVVYEILQIRKSDGERGNYGVGEASSDNRGQSDDPSALDILPEQLWRPAGEPGLVSNIKRNKKGHENPPRYSYILIKLGSPKSSKHSRDGVKGRSTLTSEFEESSDSVSRENIGRNDGSRESLLADNNDANGMENVLLYFDDDMKDERIPLQPQEKKSFGKDSVFLPTFNPKKPSDGVERQNKKFNKLRKDRKFKWNKLVNRKLPLLDDEPDQSHYESLTSGGLNRPLPVYHWKSSDGLLDRYRPTHPVFAETHANDTEKILSEHTNDKLYLGSALKDIFFDENSQPFELPGPEGMLGFRFNQKFFYPREHFLQKQLSRKGKSEFLEVDDEQR